MRNKILELLVFLLLVLFVASPALAQVVTMPSPAGVGAGGGGGGGEVTNAGTFAVQTTSLDFTDAQLDLQVAASVTADGTSIDVSGVNMVLVHATNDATWNRTGNISFEGALGGGPLSDVRSLPYIQWQNDAASDPTQFRSRQGSVVLNTVNNNQMGYWVDVRGFQTFRARLTVTGGTTGTISIHAHLVKNSDGVYNAAMALNPTGVLGATNIGDLGLLVVHSSPSLGAARTGVTSMADNAADVYASSDRGVPAHLINNEDLSVIVATEGRYSPASVDDEGRQFSILSHNTGITSGTAQVSKIEDTGAGTGYSGIPTFAVNNEGLSTLQASGDYGSPAIDRVGAAFSIPMVSDFASINRQLGKIEDFPVSSGQTGVSPLIQRADVPASSAGADNDYMHQIGDSTGHTWTHEFEVGANDFSIDRDNITTASVNIAFGFTSNKVEIRAATGNAGDICVDWAGGTAACPAANTAGDYRLEAGQILLLDSAAYTSVSIIASTGTNVVNISAWN